MRNDMRPPFVIEDFGRLPCADADEVAAKLAAYEEAEGIRLIDQRGRIRKVYLLRVVKGCAFDAKTGRPLRLP